MAHYAVTKRGEHDPGRHYDFKNRAERVIQDTRGTVVRDGDIYELRLPDPDEMSHPAGSHPAGTTPQARLQVSTSDRPLTPALGSAARIVRLLHDFDDDPDRQVVPRPLRRQEDHMSSVLPQHDRDHRHRVPRQRAHR